MFRRTAPVAPLTPASSSRSSKRRGTRTPGRANVRSCACSRRRRTTTARLRPPRACPLGPAPRAPQPASSPPHAFRLMHSASHLLCPQPFKSTECDVCNTPLPLDGDIACGGWYHKVSEEGLTEGRDLCEKHFLNRSHTEGPLSLAPPSPLFLSPPPRAPAHLPTWPPAPRLPANPDNLPARESFPTCPPPTAAPQALCA